MNKTSRWPNLLIILTLATDLFSPVLIWKGIIPGNVRWLSHLAIVTMILFIPLRMLAFNRIPFVLWWICLFSAVGILTALLTGQGISATIWGWWLLFQFPLVGLFAYLQPTWPTLFSKRLLNFLIVIIGLEVFVQIIQYMTGEIPGDNLAGTFGQNGTGDLVLFLILTLCFALGEWVLTQKWTKLVLVIFLGIISSILGEMKLFFLTLVILGVMGLIALVISGKRIWKLIPIVVVMITAIFAFIPLYDEFVPSAKEIPLESYFYNPALLTKYLTFVNKTTTGTNYYYDVGRNYAVTYGWNKINKNTQDLLLGYGIGARSESKTLGIMGRGLAEGDLGVTSGTSILVFIQESGIFGILALSCLFLVIIFRLLTQIHQNPGSHANYLRVGIIFFTILWPVWLWYNAAWTLRIPMLIYWSILGFVMSEYDHNVLLNKAATDSANDYKNLLAESKEVKDENRLFNHGT
jgi:hypothetical protein